MRNRGKQRLTWQGVQKKKKTHTAGNRNSRLTQWEQEQQTHTAGNRSSRDSHGRGQEQQRLTRQGTGAADSHGGEQEQCSDAEQAGRHIVGEVVVVEQQAGHQVQHHRVGHDDLGETLLTVARACLVLLDGFNLIFNLLQHLQGGLLPLSTHPVRQPASQAAGQSMDKMVSKFKFLLYITQILCFYNWFTSTCNSPYIVNDIILVEYNTLVCIMMRWIGNGIKYQ